MRTSVAAFAAVAALTFASAASAAVTVTTFTLDTSETFSASEISAGIGTIKVVDNGTDLFITALLDPGYEFRLANNGNKPDKTHHALTFASSDTGANLTGLNSFLASQVILPNPTAQPAGTVTQATGNGPFDNKPFTGFDYAVNCSGSPCDPGWKPSGNPEEIKFKVAGMHISDIVNVDDLHKVTYHRAQGSAKQIFFAVDIVNAFGKTGAVGASNFYQFSYAPEPETWTLIILGFGAIGAELRRRRARALAA